MALQQKITPHLWFAADAEEAVAFYCSIFKDSRVVTRSRRGECGPGSKGAVMAIAFKLDGQDFVAIDGGPHVNFSESVSFSIGCETQAEVDHYWSRLLSGGGQEQSCGWLKDRFGVCWQVNYAGLQDMLNEVHPDRADRVMRTMLTMKKIDIQTLKDAYEDH